MWLTTQRGCMHTSCLRALRSAPYFPPVRAQEMRRALFMYAKLNPGLRYIQGMNELIAPLYWLFKQDPDPQAAQFAEADAFWWGTGRRRGLALVTL